MKSSTIAIVGVVVVAIVVVGVYFALTSMPPAPISPTNFQGFIVNGGPEQSIYTVAFSLMDDYQKNGPAQGTVVFEILDSKGTVLYTTTKQLTTSNYSQNDAIIIGSKVIGYSWTIPATAVSKGVPTSGGNGQAKITFASSTGRVFSQTRTVPIPTLPQVRITSMAYDSNSHTSMQLGTPDLSTYTIYVGQTFSLPLTINPSTPISVEGITATTPGFTVLSVNPTLPKEVATSQTFTLNISVPSTVYEGELALYIEAESVGMGSMSFDSYTFTDSTHLTIYIRNTGTKTLVLSNAYLDGVAASLSPQGHNLGIGQVYGYTITFATSVQAGIAHQLRIVASDGTPLQISVIYELQQGSMAIDAVLADASAGTVTFWLRNTGTKALDMNTATASVYVNGVKQTFTGPSTLAVGAVQQYSVTGVTGLTPGLSSQLRVVASDGTPVQVSFVPSP